MTEKEAGRYLVELYADYERYAEKLGWTASSKYTEAITMAIMALASNGRRNESV